MALHAESYWKEQKESLNRIRSQLSDQSDRGTPPHRQRSGKGSRGHSPYGKYRKPSSPAQLPRIDTPEHERLKKNDKLRGNRYGVVPPVNRKSRQSPDDYDSWGEESGDESGDEGGQEYYMPQPYPNPYGYPGYHAPPVVFGAPFPVYYPPPPPPGRNKRQKDRHKDRRRDQLDVHKSQPSRSTKHGPPAYPPPPPMAFSMPGYYGYPPPNYPRNDSYESPRKEVLKKYKYKHPSPAPVPEADLVSRRYKDDAILEKSLTNGLNKVAINQGFTDSLMYYYYHNHPLFAEDFVEWLTNEFLDEIIPDVLIDTLSSRTTHTSRSPPPRSNVHVVPKADPRMAEQITDEIMKEMLPELVHDAVRGALDDMVNAYMNVKDTKTDPLEIWVNNLVTDEVTKSTDKLVKESVRQLADDHLRAKSATLVLDSLVDDHLDDVEDDVIDDVVKDVVIEDFLEKYIIKTEVDEEIMEIVKEVFDHYDAKIARQELRAVAKQAGDKLMESICMDYLLNMLAKQGKVLSDFDHANIYMDDMIVNLLFEQYFNIRDNRTRTLEDTPMRKLHEKAVTDVSLDLLLQQLVQSLDEDLADVDEYERGVDGFQSAPTTPASMSKVK